MVSNTGHLPLPYTHRLIRASAGSGKTFQLAHRYIDLLFHGAGGENILATTFTRKAAGEIFSRILLRLSEAALDGKVRKEVSDFLTDFPDGISAAQCEQKAAHLASNLHRLSITTIDGFFNSIVRCFSLELNVPTDLQMLEDGGAIDRSIKNQAISTMLRDTDINSLISWLKQWHHNTSGQTVTKAIENIVEDFYYAYLQAPDEAMWHFSISYKSLKPDEIAPAIDELKKIEPQLPKTKQGKINGNWKNAFDKDVARAQAGDWDGFISLGIAAKIAGGEENYNRKPIAPEIERAYKPLVEHARAAVLDKEQSRHLATYNLLKRFRAEYRDLLYKNNALLFSDLTYKLAFELPNEDPNLLADIYFRLDGAISHLLLDEFQDTSLEQWRVLTPLAQDITGDETQQGWDKTFFCVGDTKQAIYGWRGGCVEIFDQLPRQLNLLPEAQKHLDKSWRSAPVILDAVNRVFENIDDISVLANSSAGAKAGQQFARQFQRHAAADKNSVLGGFVALITSPPDAQKKLNTYDEDEDEPVTKHEQFVSDYVFKLNKEHPNASIGVLVLRNKTAVKILHELRQLGIWASGEGGGALIDCAAVLPLLSALQLADHPADSASAFHVAHSPLAKVIGLSGEQYKDKKIVEQKARQIRSRVMQDGYAALLSNWVKKLAPSCDWDSLSRLEQLLELAEQFDVKGSLRLGEFVNYVENTKVQRTKPAPVQVMTIHKAKGLEFDITVLPELDKNLGANQSQCKYILSRETETAPIKAVYPSSRQRVRALSDDFTKEYDKQLAKDRYEDLCNLYVAMTRAKRALYMIVKPINEKKLAAIADDPANAPLSFASILRAALSQSQEATDARQTLCEMGEKNWRIENKDLNVLVDDGGRDVADAPRRARPANSCSTETDMALLSSKLTGQLPKIKNYHIRSPSKLENSGKVRGGDILNLSRNKSASKGTIIHYWMQQVGFLDEQGAVPEFDQLLQLAKDSDRSIDDETLEKYLNQFKEIIKNETIAQALARNGATELWHERKFAVYVEDSLLTGFIDRVAVFCDDSAAPISATVIDFKTDYLPDKQSEDFEGRLLEKVKTYRPQLQAYKKAVANMLGLNNSKVAAQLLFLDALHIENL